MNNGPRLILASTDAKGKEFPLDKNVITIGRAPDNDIVVEQFSVSRNHARIERFGDNYVVSDLGSRNGIKINGAAAPEGQITDGATLAVGDVLFRAAGLPAAAAPPPAPPKPKTPALQTHSDEPTPAPLPGALPAPGPAQGLAAFAPPSVPPPPGPTPEQQAARLASQQAFQRNAERFGPAIVVLAAVLVAAAALWLVSNVIYPDVEVRTVSMQPVKLRVGEASWMAVLAGARGSLSRYYDVDPATIAVTPEGIASVERYGDQQIVVRGLSYGDATATMRAPGSSDLIQIRILVRGRLVTRADRVHEFSGTDEERLQSAANHVHAGDIQMTRGLYYQAVQEYELALLYLKRLRTASEIGVSARAKLSQATAALDKRYKELVEGAAVARKQNDYKKALELVNRILLLIPDSNDPRYQQARHFMIVWEMERQPRKK